MKSPNIVNRPIVNPPFNSASINSKNISSASVGPVRRISPACHIMRMECAKCVVFCVTPTSRCCFNEKGELWQRARGDSGIAVVVDAHYFCIVFVGFVECQIFNLLFFNELSFFMQQSRFRVSYKGHSERKLPHGRS